MMCGAQEGKSVSESINVRGIVHGKVIQFETEIGLPDGQPVTVSVRPIDQVRDALGEGIRHSAGAWADDDVDGLDAYLQVNRQSRQLDRPGIEP